MVDEVDLMLYSKRSLKVVLTLLCQNSRRPLEDDSSAAVSESKRLVLDSRGRMEAPHTSTSVASQDSAADLFVQRSAPQPVAVLNKAPEPRSRKRKEMDEDIDVDELESLMSEDFFDEVPAAESQPVQAAAAAAAFNLPEKKQETPLGGESSVSKKQRVHLEEPRSGAKPRGCSEKDSTPPTNGSRQNKQPFVSIKTEPECSPERAAVQLESSRPLRVETANSSQNILPIKDNDDGSMFEVKHHFQFALNISKTSIYFILLTCLFFTVLLYLCLM